MFDLTTQAGVADWYRQQYDEENSVERLNGGLINYVWRVTTGSGSVIVKHAAAHVSSATDIALDPARLDFEARALRLFDDKLSHVGTDDVRPPHFLDFDETEYALVMEDCDGFRDLKSWRKNLGRKLGEFFAALHTETRDDLNLQTQFDNRDVQKIRYQTQYAEVGHWFDGHVADATALGDTARAFGASLMEPGDCLIMGDAWLKSLLVSARDNENGSQEPTVRVIDWEFAHFGRPAQDLGHLAAHLWLAAMTGMEGNLAQAWRAVTSAYRSVGGAWDGALEHEIGIHAGCEILSRTVGPFADRFHPWTPAEVARNVDVAARLIREQAFSCENDASWLPLVVVD